MTLPRQAMGADDIRAVYNNTGSEIAAHVAVKKGSVVDEVALPAADTDHLLGVTLAVIPPASWGCVQIRGRAKVVAGGALATPGVALKATTAGKAAAWSASAGNNAHVLGTLETTASTDGDIVEVELNGPGSMKQG